MRRRDFRGNFVAPYRQRHAQFRVPDKGRGFHVHRGARRKIRDALFAGDPDGGFRHLDFRLHLLQSGILLPGAGEQCFLRLSGFGKLRVRRHRGIGLPGIQPQRGLVLGHQDVPRFFQIGGFGLQFVLLNLRLQHIPQRPLPDLILRPRQRFEFGQ